MIKNISDLEVSRLIIHDYFETLEKSLESDVIIVGGGPSGLVAGYTLASSEKEHNEAEQGYESRSWQDYQHDEKGH